MTNAPRPALRKAADAHVHPAAPHQARIIPTPRGLTPVVSPAGPLRGATSDSIRPSGKNDLRRTTPSAPKRKASESRESLTIQVPKSLRKEFRAALKADGKKADDVVVALLRAWLDG